MESNHPESLSSQERELNQALQCNDEIKNLEKELEENVTTTKKAMDKLEKDEERAEEKWSRKKKQQEKILRQLGIKSCMPY